MTEIQLTWRVNNVWRLWIKFSLTDNLVQVNHMKSQWSQWPEPFFFFLNCKRLEIVMDPAVDFIPCRAKTETNPEKWYELSARGNQISMGRPDRELWHSQCCLKPVLFEGNHANSITGTIPSTTQSAEHAYEKRGQMWGLQMLACTARTDIPLRLS